MPLRVVSMMQYLTAWDGVEARRADYASLMVVKAVKGRPPGGRRTTLTFGNTQYDFGPTNPGPAVDLWTAWAADRVRGIVPEGPVVLVPVPNRNAVHGGPPDFPTAQLAQRVANAVGPRVTVATELWWDQVMEPASEGGPRHAGQLYPHLVAGVSPVEGPRVLLDDVLTLGGHLKASAAKLREMGHDPQFAICCGRTAHEQLDNPFVVPVEELPDFDPADPFGFGDISIDEDEFD